MSAKAWPSVGSEVEPVEPAWELRREGRAWMREGEAWARYMVRPSKIEMVRGKLFDTDQESELLLGLLFENVGADRAVRFGDLEVWREAVAAASRTEVDR